MSRAFLSEKSAYGEAGGVAPNFTFTGSPVGMRRSALSICKRTRHKPLHLSGLKPYTSYNYYLAPLDAADNRSGLAPSGFRTTYMSAPGITNGSNGPEAGAYAVVGEAFTSYTFTGTGLPAPVLSVASAPAGAVWSAPGGTSGHFS